MMEKTYEGKITIENIIVNLPANKIGQEFNEAIKMLPYPDRVLVIKEMRSKMIKEFTDVKKDAKIRMEKAKEQVSIMDNLIKQIR
jgi:hypothetical protein